MSKINHQPAVKYTFEPSDLITHGYGNCTIDLIIIREPNCYSVVYSFNRVNTGIEESLLNILNNVPVHPNFNWLNTHAQEIRNMIP